jgi:type IV secretory pathway TrbD component
MAERVQAGEPEPVGETIHLPGPSYLPVVTAAGLAIAVIGVVQSWFLVGAGVLIALVAIVRWIRESRQEMSELPLEH